MYYVNVGKKALLSPRKKLDQNFLWGKTQSWHRQKIGGADETKYFCEKHLCLRLCQKLDASFFSARV